jgi:hypothetical protein
MCQCARTLGADAEVPIAPQVQKNDLVVDLADANM